MVSLSAAESDLHAAVKTASEGLGIQSVAKDLGIVCGLNLHLDATAKMCLVNRREHGKAKHVGMHNVWTMISPLLTTDDGDATHSGLSLECGRQTWGTGGHLLLATEDGTSSRKLGTLTRHTAAVAKSDHGRDP